MTKETLNKANEIDLNITVTRSLLIRLSKAKEVRLTTEYWDDDNPQSYTEDEVRVKKWFVEAMKRAVEEHINELQQELDAL